MLVIFIQIFLLLLYVLVLSLEDMCFRTVTVEWLLKNFLSLSLSHIFHIFILSIYVSIPIQDKPQAVFCLKNKDNNF